MTNELQELRQYLTPREIARLDKLLSKPSTKTIDLPTLRSDQQAILDHPARFKVLACGRRYGKTTLDIYVLASRAAHGETWGYFSFTYKNLAETFRELRNVLLPVTLRSSQTEGRIELQNGGLIEFWSLSTLSSDTARGRKYHGVVVDEAAYIPNGEYVWNGVIRPTLADYQGGALLTSTPAGVNHFQNWYLRGESDSDFPDWKSWCYPTSVNPLIPSTELAAIELETPSLVFRQEYLAEFVESEGAVFGDFRKALYTPPPDDKPIEGHFYCGGVDWGAERNFTSLSIIDANENREVFLDRWHKMRWDAMRARIIAACDYWGVQKIYVERNAASSNIENLQAEIENLLETRPVEQRNLSVVGFSMTNKSKSSMVNALYEGIHKSGLQLIDRPYANVELGQMVSKQNLSGVWTYDNPETDDGGHGDTVIARMAAYRASLERIPDEW